jgi:hypothetical protein
LRNAAKPPFFREENSLCREEKEAIQAALDAAGKATLIHPILYIAPRDTQARKAVGGLEAATTDLVAMEPGLAKLSLHLILGASVSRG